MRRFTMLLVLLLLSVGGSAFAQELEEADLAASPDRPTFFAAPVTVAPGHAQLEGGVQFARQDGASRLEIPMLVRSGVSQSFEFRAGLPTPTIGIGDAASDLGALQFAAKVAGPVTEQLSIGVLPFFDLASRSGDSTIFAQSDYGALALVALQFGSFSVGANGGVTVGPSSDPTSELREFFFPAALAVSYGANSFGVSLEGFSVLAEEADTSAGALIAASYAPGRTVVLDVFAAAGLAGDLPDVWFGAGATFAK